MTGRRGDEVPLRVRVPGDVERQDRIAFNLNARQLVIVSVTGLVLYAAWTAVATVVHPVVFMVCAAPVAGTAFIVAVSRRDGISFDAWLLAAWRHRRAPRHLVPADAPIASPPAWVTTAGERVALPAPLRLPAKGFTDSGLVDLGPDGTTGLVAASTVAFGLRSAGEQNSLVAGFARWLHSLDGPAQIVVHARRVDLTYLADRYLTAAPGLAHPALEDAARGHAAFLDHLAQQRELLHRQVTVAVRSTHGPHRTALQVAEAVRALGACEVPARALDPGEAQARLAACMQPIPAPPPTPHLLTDGDDRQ
ncbi:hypothetical protein Val02_66400 [Virgisporangium aliadipatigenens]|uniref:PrgI family protein n=1 Tax=Virgisporangium aliadipatigenens TaxID=741659 RepID=A0A8J3YQD6_9ACTN|nr:PrgI family protein [Virgisporangium aliadipatigenens]GIJ49754.1 hypothetical protein Val02_66400 [Virgisporangium aliadipatigenens]